jgi:predicted P-loop ATPase
VVLEEDWRKTLTTTSRGTPLSTLGNAITVLANDPAWKGVLSYDLRNARAVFTAKPPWDSDYSNAIDEHLPRPIEDADHARLVTWFERTWGIRVSTRIIAEAVNTVARGHEFDPVREYLTELKWDGLPRIDTWLARCLGAEDADYNRAVASRWMISAVARVFDPGCVADYMLILVGPQGLGKSRALRALAGDDWFTDDFPAPGNKDAAIQLQGILIAEFSELEALNRAELSALKAFVTRRVDRYRPPYGRVAQDHPRRCVLAGTTNEDSFLRDSTGNRRFWPVACGVTCNAADVAAIAADRDQLWAEAVARYHAGETRFLHEPDIVAAAGEIAERYFQRDEWEDLLAAYVARCNPPSLAVRDVLKVVLQLPEGRWAPAEQARVGKILHRLGWVKRRVRTDDGHRTNRYFPPGLATPVTPSNQPGVTGIPVQSQGVATPVIPVIPNPSHWEKKKGGGIYIREGEKGCPGWTGWQPPENTGAILSTPVPPRGGTGVTSVTRGGLAAILSELDDEEPQHGA